MNMLKTKEIFYYLQYTQETIDSNKNLLSYFLWRIYNSEKKKEGFSLFNQYMMHQPLVPMPKMVVKPEKVLEMMVVVGSIDVEQLQEMVKVMHYLKYYYYLERQNKIFLREKLNGNFTIIRIKKTVH